MSIDVEDYFQVAAFASYIERERWETMPCRVERNIGRILALLDRHDTRATFFTLGWIAERYPAMIRDIVAHGHELASHGYSHRRASEQTRGAFRDDLARAKALLEDIGGVAVRGYRAPSFSIGASNLWAHDVIAETGHVYSSSVYPIVHDHYGMPEAPRFAWRTPSGVVEIPPSSLRMLGRNLPASGGGYFRLLPCPVSRWSLRRINARDGELRLLFPSVEIDPNTRLAQPRKIEVPHYLNLERMAVGSTLLAISLDASTSVRRQIAARWAIANTRMTAKTLSLSNSSRHARCRSDPCPFRLPPTKPRRLAALARHLPQPHLSHWRATRARRPFDTARTISSHAAARASSRAADGGSKTLLFGHSLVSLPFCPYAGPLAEDRAVHDALDERAEAIGRERRVDFIEYRNLRASHRDWPTQDLYVTFRKPIGADAEANLTAIPRKQRAMVRKGIRNALTSDTGDLDAFFELFADNVHRHGTPAHSKRFFELLLEAFGDRAEVLVVRDAERRPVSAVLSLYHRDEVLPMHAGDAARARELAANDFKYWELMRRAAERGYCVFDYGRTASAAPGPSTSRRTGASSPRRFPTNTGCSGATLFRRTIR